MEILFFAATMFLIGWTEELIFRGVILNLFLERFSKTKRGILWAVILSGVFFGAVHLTNISQGVTVTSAMIRAINGAFLGVIFGAVYARSGNIWLVMTFHALVDFASLMGSGIFGTGTTVEQINQMSAINLIAVPVLLGCFARKNFRRWSRRQIISWCLKHSRRQTGMLLCRLHLE